MEIFNRGIGLRHSRSLIGGADFHDAIGVNLECHFDLGDSARSRGYTRHIKITEEIVIFSQCPLAFVDLDLNSRLIIYRCRKSNQSKSAP